jgi:hypothetical protein
MKPTEEHVISECSRVFSAIPVIDSMNDLGRREIFTALMRRCESNDHVTEVLGRFQEEARDWVNPIAELVFIARATTKPERAPDGCENCSKDAFDPNNPKKGWEMFVRDEIDGRLVHRFCDCARGQYFREMARRRLEEGTWPHDTRR